MTSKTYTALDNQVDLTALAGLTVSTIALANSSGHIRYFETLVFDATGDTVAAYGLNNTYPTEDAAKLGHVQMVLQVGTDVEREMLAIA